MCRLTLHFALMISCGCGGHEGSHAALLENVDPKSTDCAVTDVASNGLTLRLVVDRVHDVPTIDYDKPFRVVLTNNSRQPLKIYSPETLAGYFQLSFQFTNPTTGEKQVVRKRKIDESAFWKMLAECIELGREIVEIAPVESFTIEVRLNAVSWVSHSWTGIPDPDSSSQFLVTARFESSDADIIDGKTNWIGKCESEAIAVHFVAQNLYFPNDYLRSGIPSAAIRFLKDDPNMINAADTQDGTPLHIAARDGDIDTVQWLLDHGADVNSVGYNGLTPLHLSEHRDVVERILRHKPNLSIRSRVSGQTPLHKAARKFADSHDPLQKQKWKEIIGMYLAAGADYDVSTAICRDDVDRFRQKNVPGTEILAPLTRSGVPS